MKDKYIYILLISGMMSFTLSCNKKSIPQETGKAAEIIKQPQVGDISVSEINEEFNSSEQIPHSKEEDCHGVRKSIKRVKDQKAEVMLVGKNYLLSVRPGTKRYKPCEIPRNMQKAGTSVVFSAIVLEIFPNERLMGTPIRIEDIHLEK